MEKLAESMKYEGKRMKIQMKESVQSVKSVDWFMRLTLRPLRSPISRDFLRSLGGAFGFLVSKNEKRKRKARKQGQKFLLPPAEHGILNMTITLSLGGTWTLVTSILLPGVIFCLQYKRG